MIRLSEVTVKTGEDILQKLELFVINQQWSTVVVTNAIGLVKDLILATPVSNELSLSINTEPCNGTAEILTFTGEIMRKEFMDPQLKEVCPQRESSLYIHIQTACTKPGGEVISGGLWGGRAFQELRIFLLAFDSSKADRCPLIRRI